MDNTVKSLLVLMLITTACIIAFLIGTNMGTRIYTNSRIIPHIHITIDTKGNADTTYTYYRK
jgi:hypothetical protein